jgi:PAS domain S-box/diguanylate cyclase (GGDEF) domain
VGATIDAGLLTAITSVFVWRLFIRPLRFALLSEAAQAKAITDTAAEGIITIDEHGIIESLNRAAERMFAYEAREVIGKNVRILMPEPHAAEHDNFLAGYIRTGEARVIGRAQELSALRKGGTEFPIELNVAEIRVGGTRRFTAIIRDVTERRAAEDRIHRLAHYDSLTALPNRSLFIDRLTHALALSERAEKLVALLFIDLDGFKQVNDSLGHAMGDELLREVAQRMQESVRRSDTVGRMGGDEFAVILEGIKHVDAIHKIAGHIIDRVREPLQLASREVAISASIGITIYPFDAKTPTELMIDADRAMYFAKASGKNRYEFYKANLADIEPRSLPIHP